MVFAGVGVALLYKFLYGILGLWNETATWFRTRRDGVIPDATLQSDVTPEYLGLGYIIGPKIAGELASGGVLAWLALIPPPRAHLWRASCCRCQERGGALCAALRSWPRDR
jgi:uncharacterized oligopeptide transporter (OPT) family protein